MTIPVSRHLPSSRSVDEKIRIVHQGAHDRHYRDRPVVVQWTVLNRRLAVETIAVNIRHLHVNRAHHRNDVVTRKAMQTLAGESVPFAPAMSKPPNVSSVFSTIAIMCFAMIALFRGNARNIAMPNQKAVRYVKFVRHSSHRANNGMKRKRTSIKSSKNIRAI